MNAAWVPAGGSVRSVEPDDVIPRIAAAVRAGSDAPTVVAIAGSVAVGKSTFAEQLCAALATLGATSAVVATDSFLLPNARLDALGLMMRKGFPESYDDECAVAMVRSLRAGRAAAIPVYSHDVYDIVDGAHRTIDPPDVLIVEGVNALQPALADVVDWRLYLHAEERDLEGWYCRRFLELCRDAEDDPASFYRWALDLDEAALLATARHMWSSVNLINLRECIAPTRVRADAVITKASDHAICAVDAPARW